MSLTPEPFAEVLVPLDGSRAAEHALRPALALVRRTGVPGSVAEALLRTIDRPVLVVGPHARDDARLGGRVVACIDGSHESERTVDPARTWAAAVLHEGVTAR